MRENILKKVHVLFLVLIPIFLFVAIIFMVKPTVFTVHAAELSSLSQTPSEQVQNTILSQMSEPECLEFITENGIEIPQEFIGSSDLGNFVKWAIQAVESNPDYEFLYNYTVILDFAKSIKAVVNNYYNTVQGGTQVQSISALASYTLQDNTQYGSWNNDFAYYNCYIYSIGRTDVFQNPGYFSGGSFNIDMSVYEMAMLVKRDLEALGKGDVYVSNIRPTILYSNETLIAIRKTTKTGLFVTKDYHFMKFHPEGGFWTHKPGSTAILKYNHQPGDKDWIQEAIINSSGTAIKGDVVYDSEIYYIVYNCDNNWSGLTIQGTTVTGFTPQIGFNGRIDVPHGVTEIGDNAFAGKSIITRVSLPNTLQTIGNSAFASCTNLGVGGYVIPIPSSVTTVGSNAFLNTNNVPIYLEGKTSVPNNFDINWNSSGNPVYLSGNLCTHPTTTLMTVNYTQHGQLCDSCRTFVSKANHNHNVMHIPNGTDPSGRAVHISICQCGDWVTVPCSSRMPHLPGETVECKYCGQEFSNP